MSPPNVNMINDYRGPKQSTDSSRFANGSYSASNGYSVTNGNSFASNGGYGGPRGGSGSYSNGYGNNNGGGRPRYGGPGGNRRGDVLLVAPGPITVRKEFFTQVDTGASAKRSPREIEEFYQTEQITVKGHSIPRPVLSFTDLKWPDRITEGIRKQGYSKPTPIQSQGWPIALSGRDMVGIAQTGSGKTMAYVLPAFLHIDGQPRERRDWGPMVLIMAPTRELAQQIQENIQQFNVYRSVCVFGGASKGPQIRDINRLRPLIIVATPGRLNDFLESQILSMSNISFLVLDEADRMLDMGFEPQIRKIVNQIPTPDRQTLMWSATWPKEVRTLAEDFLKDYVQLNVGALQLHANHNITQIVDVCDELEKTQKLYALLGEILGRNQDNKDNKTIIFAETKKKVDELTRALRSQGWPAMCIHGDKSQQERDWVLREFKNGKSPILVATDVAARGLDVDDIKYVVNFDYPSCSEDYVHRIGRTGRRDRLGTAYTFFTRNNSKQATDLIGVLKEANQQINPKLYEMSMQGNRGGKDRRRWGFAPRQGGYGGGGGYNNGYGGYANGGSGGFKRRFEDGNNSFGGGNAPKRQYTGGPSGYGGGGSFHFSS